MTTLQMATLVVAAQVTDTREARWNAWKSKGAATDRITQRHMRIAFAVVLMAQVCVTIAMVL